MKHFKKIKVNKIIKELDTTELEFDRIKRESVPVNYIPSKTIRLTNTGNRQAQIMIHR